jgi:hypothetical protein
MLEKDLNEIAEFRLYFENYLHQFKMTDKSHGFINAGNYYKLDAAIVNAIVFRKGLKAYSFEQFDLRYNRPDIVLERINPDIKERSPELQSKIERIRMAWKKRVRENGFTPEQLTGKTPMHAPEINNIKAAMDETKWYNASIYSDSTRGEKLEDLPAETDKPKLKLQFSIKDEEGENCSGNNGQQKICDIIGYRVFVNGVPLHGETLQRFKKPAATQDVNEEVTLSAIGYDPNHEGENKIELSGFTEDGAESFREPVYITYHPPTPVKPRLFIAAFGINDYNGNKDFRNLHYAVKDAREFVDTFSKNNSGYEGEPLIFRGGAVTNNDVNVKSMDELKTFLKSANENDTVLVYFSGHGLSKSVMRNDLNQIVDETKSNGARLFKDHEYYFITKDADLNNLEKNAIKIDSIRHALASSSSRQKMLFLDTCQSYFDDKSGGKGLENDDGKEIVVKMKNGGKMKFRDSRSPKGFSASLKESELLVDLGSMFPELRRGTGTIEVSAAINGQAAQEGYELKDGTKIENGVFTYVLKEAIVKAKDEKGHISAQNLRRYVLEMVQEMTTDENGNVHQSPMVSRDIAGRDFMVVR